MQSRTPPSNITYDHQPQPGESSGYMEHASHESVPTIERISPDNKHPSFPPPTSHPYQYEADTHANYAGKGKAREF